MTEPEWLAQLTVTDVAEYLDHEASPRKQGRYMQLLCRMFSEVFTDPRSLAALDAADRYDAGEIEEPAYRSAIRAADAAREDAEESRRLLLAQPQGRASTPARMASMAAGLASHVAYHVAETAYYRGSITHLRDAIGFRAHSAGQIGRPYTHPIITAARRAFGEIFGNPFRPVTADPAWLTSTVASLATSIYAEKAFDRLPILADALMDAGCENADVLAHCRSDGPHVRGCWVVDLLLGKE